MGARDSLREALDAVAELDPTRLRAHAGPALTVFAPFEGVAPPGQPGGDALETALARVGAWAGGPLRPTSRLVDGAWAVGEYERDPDGAPLTAVVRGDEHGHLRDLRLYLDVGPEEGR